MRLLRWGLALALVSALQPAVAAPASPADSLIRMGDAVRTLDYRGRFIHLLGDRIQTFSVVHRGGPDGGRERLVSVDGEALEIVSDADTVRSYRADEDILLVDDPAVASPLQEALPRYSEQLAEHYRFEALGMRRIADREARGFRIRPRDGLRFGYRVWMDLESGLPLETELLDDAGRIVEMVRFVEIALGVPIADHELALSSVAETARRVVRAVDGGTRVIEAGLEGWRPEDLPAGFGLSTRTLEDRGRHQREQLVFSDGLASVSVFIEPVGAVQDPLAGSAQLGNLRALGLRVGDRQVTLLGEVPALTLERIAAAIERP